VFKKLLLLFNGLWIVILCFGQNSLSPVVIATGGSFFSAEGYSLSYTYGELSVSTLTKNSNILTEGFQQGKYHPTGPPPINEIQYFPNPVDKYLNLIFYVNDGQSFTIQIFNILGKATGFVIRNNVLNGEHFYLDFSGYAKGLYLVKLQSKNGKILRTFKIEKI
jgi:hypothetical protein